MNDLKDIIRHEWEICLSATLLLLCGCLAVVVFFAGKPADSSGLGGSNGQPAQPLLADSALDFLRPASTPAQTDRNPFRSPLQPPAPPEPPAPRPAQPPAVKPQPVSKPAPVKPAPTPPAAETAPATPPPPAPVYFQRQLTFAYHQQDSTGKSIALIKWATTPTDAEMQTLAIGDTLDGITILAITNDEVKAQDAYGKNVYLLFGKPRVVVGKKLPAETP